MALFRKFFLKKTPDRLLEISERVYGIMPASLGPVASAGCGIRLLRRGFPGFVLVWFRGFRILRRVLFSRFRGGLLRAS
jgi:hypothetical protein